MHVLCPHCRSPIELVRVTPEEILCPACGSTFRLEGEATATWAAADGSRSLGRFELIEAVGTGAFGTVYKARDTRLDRTVAVKVPRAGNLGGGEDRDRFVREARSAAQLRHPAIVPVHEVGEHEGTPYIVSDFVPGVTLSEWLTARQPTFREAAGLVAEMADALEYAHGQGVVHRDIKPSNIMLDEGGHPHVMDFGLAKRDAGEVTMTMEGQVLGTPAYMSPEQARGEGHAVDGRSDVYSLGVILYLLLTGELPFRGAARMLLHQVLNDEPKPPRSLNDRIPRDLDTIALRAMAKEPPARYASALALADDLRRFLDGQPIISRPAGRLEKVVRWARRRPAVAGLLVAIVGVSLVGFATVAMEWQRAEAALDRERLARGDEARANAQTLGEKSRAEKALKEADANLYLSTIALADAKITSKEFAQAERALLDVAPERRGWEWHLLKRLARTDRLTIAENFSVESVRFSPDGTRLLTFCHDGFIRIRDTVTGGLLVEIPTGARPVLPDRRPLAISPDGKLAASVLEVADPARGGRYRNAVKIWDASSGREVKSLLFDAGILRGAAFSPDGATLAVFGVGPGRGSTGISLLALWRFRESQELEALDGHSGTVYRAVFTPDGRRLISIGSDGTGRIWDLAGRKTIRVLRALPIGNLAMRGVAVRPDGSRVATADAVGRIRIWDASTGDLLRTWQASPSGSPEPVYSPDGSLLALCGDFDKSARLFEPETGKERRVFLGHTGDVVSLAFHPDGSRLATASSDRTVKIWDVVERPKTLNIAAHRTVLGTEGPVLSLAFDRDGKRLVSSGMDSAVREWDAATGEELRSLPAAPGPVSHLVFREADNSLIGVGVVGKTVIPSLVKMFQAPDPVDVRQEPRVFVRTWDSGWNATTRSISLGPLRGSTVAVRLSPDGGRMIWASMQEGAVLDLPAFTAVRRMPTWGYFSTSYVAGVVVATKVPLVFSADGRLLTARANPQNLSLLDVDSGREIVHLGNADFSASAFDREGRRVAVSLGSDFTDREVVLLDTASGRQVGSLRGASGHPAIHPDGKCIAVVDEAGKVSIWDIRTGRELLTLRGNSQNSQFAVFSPDGHRLAAGSDGGTITIWDATPAEPPQQITEQKHR